MVEVQVMIVNCGPSFQRGLLRAGFPPLCQGLLSNFEAGGSEYGILQP